MILFYVDHLQARWFMFFLFHIFPLLISMAFVWINECMFFVGFKLVLKLKRDTVSDWGSVDIADCCLFWLLKMSDCYLNGKIGYRCTHFS